MIMFLVGGRVYRGSCVMITSAYFNSEVSISESFSMTGNLTLSPSVWKKVL